MIREFHDLLLPDSGGEGFDRAKAEVFVELHGAGIGGGNRKGKQFEAAAGEGADGMLHQLAADAMALITRFYADLRGVCNARVDGGSEDHADGWIIACRAHEKRSIGEKLSAAGKQNDVAKEPHAARFGSVLVVDFGIDVPGIGDLDEARGGIEVVVRPGLDPQAAGESFVGESRFVNVQQHELASVEAKVLREESGIEPCAEGHELGFDALEKRGRTEGMKHLAEKLLVDWCLVDTRGDEKTADEPLEILQHEVAIADRFALDDGHVAAQRARIHKFADQINRRAVVPEELFLPTASFLLEKRIERLCLDLSEIQNLHGLGRSAPGDIIGSGTCTAKLPERLTE